MIEIGQPGMTGQTDTMNVNMSINMKEIQRGKSMTKEKLTERKLREEN